MKFLSALFGKKASDSMNRDEPEVALTPAAIMAANPDAPLVEDSKPASGAINIWDMDDDDAEQSAPAKPAASRRRRNATRLIGFDNSQGEVVDLFQDADEETTKESVKFPVGWLLVIGGEGRGHCFSLNAGMNQIGRGEDNAVKLDFGDTSISRDNHAAIVFDEEERKFILGHGGKKNVVRLNNKPVISNEDLSEGAQIKIGETLLQLKTLCGDDFNWDDAGDGDDEERDDVAIA